ncbi:MAG: cyclase family protein [Candidatus Dormibacteraceae bacterium]
MPETIETNGHRLTVYDLSQRLSNRTEAFEPNRHHIEYHDWDDTAAMSLAMFGIGAEYWPDNKVFAVETVTASTHAGTHVDAPYHYGPPASGDVVGIDQVPLRWCFGDGVRLDFRHKAAAEGIRRDDVERALEAMEYGLKPFDIVLIWTGTDVHFGQSGYENMHPGLRRDATEYLIDAGVRLIGIDAWGIDRPFQIMVEEALAGDKDQLWESHVLGRRKPYSQIEKLCNLEQLPRDRGFTVSALPVKLEGCSAAWSRVIAIFWD